MGLRGCAVGAAPAAAGERERAERLSAEEAAKPNLRLADAPADAAEAAA